MSLDLFERETEERYERLTPLERPEAGAWHGFARGSASYAMRNSASAARAISMAGAVFPIAYDLMTKGTEAQERYFRDVHDETFQRAVDYWTPRPGEVGMAGQMTGTLLSLLPLVVASPGLAVATTQLSMAEDLIKQGVDPVKAQQVGAVYGAGIGLGIYVPILGRTLTQRMLLGGAGFNVAQGVAMRAGAAEILEGTPAEGQFRPFGGEDLTFDILLGLAFGGLAHLSPAMRAQGEEFWARVAAWRQNIKPEELAALAAMRQAQHAQVDSLPGKPATPEALEAHVERLRASVEQLAKDERVDVTDLPQPRMEADMARLEESTARAAELVRAAEEMRQDEGLPRAPEVSRETGRLTEIQRAAPEEQPRAIAKYVEEALGKLKIEETEAKANASLWEAFFRTAADRYAIPAARIFERYGLQIRSLGEQETLPGALEQMRPATKAPGTPDYVRRVVDTTMVDEADQMHRGPSAGVQEGELIAYHVTDDPTRVRTALETGRPLTEGRELDLYGDLGRGLYVSGIPHFWTGRSAKKWDFLARLTEAERNRIADALERDKNVTGEQKGYYTASERERVQTYIERFRAGNNDVAGIIANQPYNLNISRPDFLNPLGIKPGTAPRAIEFRLRGRFAELTRNISDAEAETLRGLGYDGAFVPMSMGTSAQTVVWNPRAARAVGEAEVLFQDDVPAGRFYSELRRQIEAVKQESATPEQWKGMVKNLKGVKRDEVQWSGLQEWLDLRTADARWKGAKWQEPSAGYLGDIVDAEGKPLSGLVTSEEARTLIQRMQEDAEKGVKVTKQEILEFLQGNAVRVEEVLLGAKGAEQPPTRAIRLPTDDEVVNDVALLREGGFSVEQDPAGVMWGVMDPQGDIYTERAMVPADVEAELSPRTLSAIRRVTEYLNEIVESVPAGQTKHGQWQLPGGQNYRELLITLPEQAPAGQRRNLEVRPARDGDGYAVWEGDQQISAGALGRNAATLLLGDFQREAAKQGAPRFTAGHWDEPNVLAHVRFNERTDAEGKRVLFVEEIQSDWAQKGKREGFAGDETGPAARLKEAQQHMQETRGRLDTYGLTWRGDRTAWAVFDAEGNRAVPLTTAQRSDGKWVTVAMSEMTDQRFVDSIRGAFDSPDAAWNDAYRGGRQPVPMTPEQWEGWQDLQNAARDLNRAEVDVHNAGAGVPRAPFVGKTEAWVGLTLKRMIAWAIENGFDRVAWTTGEQQTVRYTSALRKAVDSIEWTKTEKGVQLVGYKGARAPSFRIVEQDGRATPGFRSYGTEVAARDDYYAQTGRTIQQEQLRIEKSTAGTKVVDTTEREDALSDAIGKAMADRILKDPAQSGTIEGEGLRIDKTGMASFYDRMVPNVANDILKRLGGGKVKEVGIDMQPQTEPITGGRIEQLNQVPDFDDMSDLDRQAFAGAVDFADGEPPLVAETTIRLWQTETASVNLPVQVIIAPDAVHLNGENFEFFIDMPVRAGQTQDGALDWVIRNWGRNGFWQAMELITGELPGIPKARELAKQQGFDITPAMVEHAKRGLPLFQAGRGQIQFGDRQTVIGLFENADRSTFLHETGHFFLQVTRDLASKPTAPEPAMRDWATLAKWLKIEGGEIPREAHEQFARGFERYLAEGKAPTEGLRGVFEQFKRWLLDIYHSLTDLDVTLSDDVRAVFDRMLGAPEAEGPAGQARAAVPPPRRARAQPAGPEAPREREPSQLLREVRELGGIDQGQLPDITGERRFGKVKGLPWGVFRPPKKDRAGMRVEGRGLDDMARSLRERGWDIPEENEVAVLSQMLEQEMKGTRAVRLGEEGEVMTAGAIMRTMDDIHGEFVEAETAAAEKFGFNERDPRYQAEITRIRAQRDAAMTEAMREVENPIQAEAARLAHSRPNLKIRVGEDEQGNPRNITVREYLEEASRATEQATEDAKLFELAAGCLTGTA